VRGALHDAERSREQGPGHARTSARDGEAADLVQLLVAKVDAQLLERVAVKDLKAVDVEHADGEALVLLLGHERVAAQHDPVKQAAVAGGGVPETPQASAATVRSVAHERTAPSLAQPYIDLASESRAKMAPSLFSGTVTFSLDMSIVLLVSA